MGLTQPSYRTDVPRMAEDLARRRNHGNPRLPALHPQSLSGTALDRQTTSNRVLSYRDSYADLGGVSCLETSASLDKGQGCCGGIRDQHHGVRRTLSKW